MILIFYGLNVFLCINTDTGHFEVRYGPTATFLNFEYRCLRRHWQSEACAYDVSDRKFPQEQDLEMIVYKVIRNLVYIRLILISFTMTQPPQGQGLLII